MRYKRDTYRRVWARKYWQPKDGNQLKSGYLEYDMNEHVHKPPAGIYIFINLMYYYSNIK